MRTGIVKPSIQVHEVVPDHMAHIHMGVFDATHVVHGDLDVQLSFGTELAAVAPGQRNRAAFGLPGLSQAETQRLSSLIAVIYKLSLLPGVAHAGNR